MRSTNNNNTVDIPLETVVTHSTSGRQRNGTNTSTQVDGSPYQADTASPNEKSGLFHRGIGRRRVKKVNSRDPSRPGETEEGTLTSMGKVYTKIMNFSIITRYFLYVLPLALIIAVPIIVGATAAKNAVVGHVRLVWLFTWVEVGEISHAKYARRSRG